MLEHDGALRVLQVLVQAPPLLPLTTPSPMTVMVNTCPKAFKPPLVDIEWVRLCGYTVQVAVLVSAKERRHEALASAYERALCY